MPYQKEGESKRLKSKQIKQYSSHSTDNPLKYDVVIIGGGSAGLACAATIAESSACSILVIEREQYLGGVLPQCIHDGFGLYCFEESLTGPEYAQLWERRVRDGGVDVACASTVLSVVRVTNSNEFEVEALGVSLGGLVRIRTQSVVCATGCRERTRGAMQIPGGRPAGVLTAGTAQYMMNIGNQFPGDKVAILGSGDIGLIMARRMTLEGAQVRMVLGQEATGLLRNHIQCIQDFGIPIRYGWGLVRIHGYGQLQGITIAPLEADGSFDLSQKEYLRCNVLLIACGLIPEREVLERLDPSLFFGQEENAGEEVFEPLPGLFVCGNAHIPHDLVDQVTQEGIKVGLSVLAQQARIQNKPMPVLPDDLNQILNRHIAEQTGRVSEIDHIGDGISHLVCTRCPHGCIMTRDFAGRVEGALCERGSEFADQEQTNPERLFTGTIKIECALSGQILLPVRSAQTLPKEALRKAAQKCRRIRVTAPLKRGDIVCEDIASTGIALVAAQDCEAIASGEAD